MFDGNLYGLERVCVPAAVIAIPMAQLRLTSIEDAMPIPVCLSKPLAGLTTQTCNSI